MIAQEAEGRAQAARIRAVAEAEAEAIRMKAQALIEAGDAYLDLRRLELAPALTREVAAALANGQFVNFGTGGGGGHSAAATGSDDVLRVVQTLMAAQIITGNGARTESRAPALPQGNPQGNSQGSTPPPAPPPPVRRRVP